MTYQINDFIDVLESASEVGVVSKTSGGAYYLNPTLTTDKKPKADQLVDLFENTLDVTAEVKEEWSLMFTIRRLFIYYDHDVRIGDFTGRAYRILI